MPPSEPRMTRVQQGMVKGALQVAIEDGIEFNSVDDVDEYLSKEALLPVDLLQKHGREIFSCYLGLQKEFRNTRQQEPRQLLSPSLSSNEGSHFNSLETARDDCSDQSETAAPTFDSHDTIFICFYSPTRNVWSILTAKNCKGSVSYISEKVVREHHLRRGQRGTQSILLDWRYTGEAQSTQKSRTRCQTAKPESLPSCDIALGEDCGKQDSEESEEEEESEEAEEEESSPVSASKPQYNDMVLFESFEATTLHDLSPEQMSHVRRTTAAMNFESAMHEVVVMTKRKAIKATPSMHFDLPSSPPEIQRAKRSRMS